MYTKLMNSNNSVTQSACVLVCSLETPRAAGVPADRMIFPLAAGEANDADYVANRPSLVSSPGIRAAGRAAFARASLGVDDVAHLDIYSCFPSAAEVAATELGLGPEVGGPGRPRTGLPAGSPSPVVRGTTT